MSEQSQSKQIAAEPSAPAQKQIEYLERRRRYWDEHAESLERWEGPRRYYRRRLAELYRFLIPPGARVLEIGCGAGHLLSSLKPSLGVGIDLSPRIIERARENYPHLAFYVQDAHQFDLGQQFDSVIASDLVNDLWDVQLTFETIARHVHASSRLVLNFYSRCGKRRGLWRKGWAWRARNSARTG